MDLEDIKREIMTNHIRSATLQDEIHNQNEIIVKLTRYLQKIKQEHTQQMQKVQAQITIKSDDEQAAFINKIKQEIQDEIGKIEAASDQAINGLIEASKKKLESQIKKQEEEQAASCNGQLAMYRKTYVEQLSREKQQLEKQLIVAQQKNAEHEDRVKQLRETSKAIRDGLRKIINDDFLDEDLDAEQLQKRLNDAASIAGYTELSTSQQSRYTATCLENRSQITSHGDTVQRRKNPQEQPTAQKQYVSLTLKHPNREHDDDINEFLQFEEEQKKRKLNPHTRCEQQIQKYGQQIIQMHGLIKKMKDDLKVVIEQTIQCLRDTNLIQTVYLNGRPNLSQHDKERLICAMGKNTVLVQALLRMGDFKAGGLGVSRQLNLLKEDPVL